MKRAGVLLLAVLLLGALVTAPAQAAAPARVKAAAKAPAKVASYWTKERMRAAVPLDEVLGQAAKVPLAYPFERYEPSTYNPAHGKVFFSDGAANYVCSGTALQSGNESVVWTAGHCVNEGPGGFYTNWAFVPGYKDGAAPYGTWSARELMTTAPWANGGDFGYDLGAAVVAANGGATLTDTVGSRGVGFDQPAEQHYLSHGYPAAPPCTGERMFICGSSGGGWVVGNTVLSVNSYGYATQPGVMYGPYQGGVAQQLYTSAAAG